MESKFQNKSSVMLQATVVFNKIIQGKSLNQCVNDSVFMEFLLVKTILFSQIIYNVMLQKLPFFYVHRTNVMKRMTVKLISICHIFSGFVVVAAIISRHTMFTIVAVLLSFQLLVRYLSLPVSRFPHPQPLHSDFVYCSLLIYSKQRIFVVSHFKCPSPVYLLSLKALVCC